MNQNYVLTTNLDYTADLALWQAYYKLLQSVLVQNGLDEDRYSCLEPLCQQHLGLETEHRKHAWVKFYVTALCCGGTDLPDVCSCDDLDLSHIGVA